MDNIIIGPLGPDESLFVNPGILEAEYLPRLLPYREEQVKYIADCIKPLMAGRNGRNLIITGAPGIGKTASTKFVFRMLKEETNDVLTLYVNCWKRDSTFKIVRHLAELLELRIPERIGPDELFDLVLKHLKIYKGVVLAFDEIDKVMDYTFLYRFLEDLPFRTMLLITNAKEWTSTLDQRLLSRLLADRLEFKPYNLKETQGILMERKDCTFVANTWERSALDIVVKKAFELHDIRSGLWLLKTAGEIAERRASRFVQNKDTEGAIAKLHDFQSAKNLQGFLNE
jgi:cell division control protein 6